MHSRRDFLGYSAILLCVMMIVISPCNASADEVPTSASIVQGRQNELKRGLYLEFLTKSDFQSFAEGRSFGHHFLKRISFAMLPLAFVVGVVTTLLAALTSNNMDLIKNVVH